MPLPVALRGHGYAVFQHSVFILFSAYRIVCVFFSAKGAEKYGAVTCQLGVLRMGRTEVRGLDDRIHCVIFWLRIGNRKVHTAKMEKILADCLGGCQLDTACNF